MLAGRPKSVVYPRCPVPMEGRLAIVTNAGRDAVDAAARETNAVCWRTAKSCGSDAPMLASSLREEAQATVSNKPGHRGEHEGNRKTIARGMPGDFRCDRGDYARVLCFNFAREATGAASARHSLRPLTSAGGMFTSKTRACRAARSRSCGLGNELFEK